jgi:hypothetical protein
MDNYYDLGTHRRPVSTTSREAQMWFDRGLLWCYGFHHEESIRCLEKAAEFDPNCAMAYWGIAYASGSNYNKPWEAFGGDELRQGLAAIRQAMATAMAHLESASLVEQALIRALVHRYPSAEAGPGAFSAWNDAYANAMREVHAAFPNDLDVSSLFAEALINRTPWKLWDLKTGRPPEGASTREAAAVLEQALSRIERDGLDSHPGLLHMYVHTMEMSPHHERALRAADALRDLVPDAGHYCRLDVS